MRSTTFERHDDLRALTRDLAEAVHVAIRLQGSTFKFTVGPDDGLNVGTGAVRHSTLPFSRQGRFVAASHLEPDGGLRAEHARAYLQGGDHE